MKIWIDRDERYPDYSYSDKEFPYTKEAEITEEELAFIRQATEQYEKAQDILEKLYERPVKD